MQECGLALASLHEYLPNLVGKDIVIIYFLKTSNIVFSLNKSTQDPDSILTHGKDMQAKSYFIHIQHS